MSGKYDSRYGDNLSYDRQPLQERRRSPSPRSGFHDRYSASRAGPSYREEYTSSYRSDPWRTERAHYNRTPSPERFRDTHTVHPETQQPWSRQSAWRNPESPQWPDKHPEPLSAHDNGWPRPRRDSVTDRLFEPSENWKQSHPGASNYQDGPGGGRVYDPTFEYARRNERSPERALPRSNYNYSESRYQYRSPSVTDRDVSQLPLTNPRATSYRSQYDAREQRDPRYSPETLTVPGPTESWTRDQHQNYHPRPRQGYTNRGQPIRDGPSAPSPQASPTNSRFTFSERGRRGSLHSAYGDGGRAAYRATTDPYRAGNRSRSSSRSSGYGHSRQPPPRQKSPTPYDNHTESLASTPHGDRAFISREHSPVPNQLEPLEDKNNFARQRRSLPPYTPAPELQTDDQDIYGQSSISSPELRRSHPPSLTTGEPLAEPLTAPTNQSVPSPPGPEIDESSRLRSFPEVARISAVAFTSEDSAPGLADISQSFQTSEMETPVIDVAPTEVFSTREPTMTPSMPATPAEEPTEARVVTTAIIPQTIIIPEKPLPAPVAAPAPVEIESLSHALRMVVMMRLRCDRQTREERVAPVLAANLSVAEASSSKPSTSASQHLVVQEMMGGERLKVREASFDSAKPSLEVRFAQREVNLNEKVQRLREEYLTLHDRWLIHCARLDEVAKAGALEEAAATAGRTTRRSTATLGDAVRSDLEMEQIIASLGNEELTDANHLSARNAALIPDMIAVTRGEVDNLYDDTNNLVDDPADFYAPRTGTDDWTEDEVNIFLRKFAEHPKQFGIIADSLPEKTTAQCVTFYYLHKKKHLDFRKVVSKYATGRRGRGGRRSAKKKGNALLADIMKRDAEVSREHTPATTAGRRAKPVVVTTGETKRAPAVRRNNSHLDQTPASTPTPDPEPEPRRKRRRVTTARAVASLEQDANLEDIDPEAKPKRGRKPRKVKVVDTTATNSPIVGNDDAVPLPSETKFIDQTELTASAKRKSQQGNVVWSDDDKAQFLVLLRQYGDDFKRIAASMPNKTTIQVSSFYKTNLVEMDLEKVAAGAPKRSPTPESPQDAWKDGTHPSSGILTPNSGITAPSSEGITNVAGLSMESRFRVNGRPVPSRGRTVDPVITDSTTGLRFRSTTAEAIQAHLSTSSEASRCVNAQTMASPSANPPSSDTPQPSTLVPTAGHITNPSPFTSAGPLTTTFPSSFPYTNLSPSHFTNGGSGSGPRPSSRVGSHGASESAANAPPATGPSIHTFDASFTRWTHQLQTTDDLAAYLEHRTRIAGQQ